jgi:hypothetical protein
LSDVIWAAAITGGVGIAGSVTTYLAARHQANNALKAEIRKVDADLERLRMEQAEPHLQHRQGVYHDFLDSAHRFWEERTFPIGLFEGVEDVRSWFLEFEHHLSAVRLFGTAQASRAAQDLADVMGEMMEEIQIPEDRGVLGRLFDRGGAEVSLDPSPEIQQRYLNQWEATIEAMRLDTGPKADS